MDLSDMHVGSSDKVHDELAQPKDLDHVDQLQSETDQIDDLYPGFTCTKKESGLYTLVLDKGCHPELALLSLQGFYNRDDIAEIDLSTFPTESDTGSGVVYCDHKEFAFKILPFIFKENLVKMLLPDPWIRRVKGACQGLIVDTMRHVVGNTLDVLGIKVKIRDVLGSEKLFLDKITATHDDTSHKSFSIAVQVLKDILHTADVPYLLGNAVIKAAKHLRHLRKNKRKHGMDLQSSDEDVDKVNPVKICDNSNINSARSDPQKEKIEESEIEKSNLKINPPQSESNNIQLLLGRNRYCYICKKMYTFPKKLHKVNLEWYQYPMMCSPCASFNFHKRNQTTNLKGKYAVVTGGRIKIGYHIVLKLLRDGCHVITTTRFPCDAANRFQKEADYHQFKERLKIYPLDLRNLKDVYGFIEYVQVTFPHLDILINNAAQTIRRPKEFFQHLIEYETLPQSELPEAVQTLVVNSKSLDFENQGNNIPIVQDPIDTFKNNEKSLKQHKNKGSTKRKLEDCDDVHNEKKRSNVELEPTEYPLQSDTNESCVIIEEIQDIPKAPTQDTPLTYEHSETSHKDSVNVCESLPPIHQHVQTGQPGKNRKSQQTEPDVCETLIAVDPNEQQTCLDLSPQASTSMVVTASNEAVSEPLPENSPRPVMVVDDPILPITNLAIPSSPISKVSKAALSDPSVNTLASPPNKYDTVSTYFPHGELDADGQQMDLRPQNSWRMCLEQVTLAELLEVMAINSVAPFILTQQLKMLMDKSPAQRRFIVNVSAMEGQFSRVSKNHFHPHTNMAKAALNMLTRTAAVGFRETGVYMTAVDTGWVTNEKPYPQVKQDEEKGFILPLDCVDGAARVYDPIVTGFNNPDEEPYFSVFLKDYKPYPW